MARPKRKAAVEPQKPSPEPKPKRQKKTSEITASSIRPSRTALAAASTPRSTRASLSRTASAIKNVSEDTNKSNKTKASVNGTPVKTKNKNSQKGKQSTPEPAESAGLKAQIAVDVPRNPKAVIDSRSAHDRELEEHGDGPSYWLMKAEPESRMEKGKDVKFSIDDLKAANEPEGWDGVRNYVARNNMRLMMKGDLAFFYHSSCKVPGIVGTMEIVREHSDDETAFDPDHPYHDEKSSRENPKWCLVHVEFRQKFPEIIPLKELQKYAKDGGILEHMQVLKQSRLSVSKVTKKEWDFVMGLVDMDDVAAASAQHQPKMVEDAPITA